MGNLIEKVKSWFRLSEVDPVADEKLIWKIILMTERGAIMVVALVSGVAVAAYGYLLASGYTSLEVVRWLTAGVLFALATAITDVGVKYFIQKTAYDSFAALNPSTYKGVRLTQHDLIMIAISGLCTVLFAYFFEIPEDYRNLFWVKCLWYPICVLVFFVSISASEVVMKMFFDVEQTGAFTWFQRAMQVIGSLVMVGLIVGMFLFDYISTDSVRRPVANMVKKEQTINSDSIRKIVIAQENARVEAVGDAITAINADIITTTRSMNRAKESAGASNMRRLADSGNGWAKQQIKAAQVKAMKPYQKRIDQLEQDKADLREQQKRDLAMQSATIARTDSTTLATNSSIEGRNEDLVSGTSTMFIWLGFWAKCIAGGLRVLLVVLFLAGNPKDFNGDGKTDFRDVTPAAERGFLAG